MDMHDFWNAALTLGVLFGGFMLNRVTSILDKLQEADKQLADELHRVRADYVPKNEFIAYGDRLEKRLEAYHALQMESNKTMFAKLDLLTERMSEKISRQECIQMMSDRRGAPAVN